MTRLTDMPNIGTNMEQKLIDVGIRTPDDLRELGSREAYLRLKVLDPGCCLSCLCGLEGAIRGVRWHDLDHETRAELKAFLKASNLL